MFDRHRQPWQCSIITDCGEDCYGFASWLSLQCGSYYGELQTQNQIPRHSLGLGAVVT